VRTLSDEAEERSDRISQTLIDEQRVADSLVLRDALLRSAPQDEVLYLPM
jgi:hypothetical protein